MALKLNEQQKAYDNMLRQLNSDIVKAYKHLGENSDQYKNLVILGASNGVRGHYNKNGIWQFDRTAKQIKENMNDNILGAIKEQYYHHDKKGNISKDKYKKGVISTQYNVTNKINQIKQDAKKFFNTKTPTTKQMVYMAEKDLLVSEFWNKYSDSADDTDNDGEHTTEYYAMQDTANRIYGGYDISNKPQTAEDFDRLHNLVGQALSETNSIHVSTDGGYIIDLYTGEVIGKLDERTRATYEEDYFMGDDWIDILI